jgi:hypothetical protein
LFAIPAPSPASELKLLASAIQLHSRLLSLSHLSDLSLFVAAPFAAGVRHDHACGREHPKHLRSVLFFMSGNYSGYTPARINHKGASAKLTGVNHAKDGTELRH